MAPVPPATKRSFWTVTSSARTPAVSDQAAADAVTNGPSLERRLVLLFTPVPSPCHTGGRADRPVTVMYAGRFAGQERGLYHQLCRFARNPARQGEISVIPSSSRPTGNPEWSCYGHAAPNTSSRSIRSRPLTVPSRLMSSDSQPGTAGWPKHSGRSIRSRTPALRRTHYTPPTRPSDTHTSGRARASAAGTGGGRTPPRRAARGAWRRRVY